MSRSCPCRRRRFWNVLIESVKKPVKVQIRLECIMEKNDPITGEVTTDSYYPSSLTSNIFPTTNISEKYDEVSEKISNDISEYQKNGSGWTLKKVVRMIVKITKYQIVRGAGFSELPKFITSKKTVINIKNEDDMCFKYAVTRALHPVEKKANVVSKLLRKQSEKYNWEGLIFPTSFPGLFPFCHWEGGKRPWHRAVFYVFWLVNDKHIIMQIMQSWINLFKLWDKFTFSRKECPLWSIPLYFVRLRNIFGKIVKFDKIYTQFVEG